MKDKRFKLIREIMEVAEQIKANKMTLYCMIATMTDKKLTIFHKKTVKNTEEDKISYSYSFLRRKMNWEEFCDMAGIDYYAVKNGLEIKDSEIFYVAESQAKKFNLL